MRKIYKRLGLIISASLIIGATVTSPAIADTGLQSALNITEIAWADPDATEFSTSDGRDELRGLPGLEASMQKELEHLVDDTLDIDEFKEVLNAVADSGSLEATGLEAAAEHLPHIDQHTGEVRIPHPEGNGEFAITLLGSATRTHSENTALISGFGSVSGMAHLTSAAGGQIVAILSDESSSHVDFEYRLPAGYLLRSAQDGSINVVDGRGESQGVINKPWAIDADGERLTTWFDIREGVIRQNVDTSTARFPIALDPSWGWWVATGSYCAAEIAIAFTPLKIAKIAKSLSSLARRSKTVERSISALGGASKAVGIVVKEMANRLKASARGAWWARPIPTFSLNSTQRQHAGRVLAFAGANAWEFLGFGSCGLLLAEIRK